MFLNDQVVRKEKQTFVNDLEKFVRICYESKNINIERRLVILRTGVNFTLYC